MKYVIREQAAYLTEEGYRHTKADPRSRLKMLPVRIEHLKPEPNEQREEETSQRDEKHQGLDNHHHFCSI
jgi:hypothetical protein